MGFSSALSSGGMSLSTTITVVDEDGNEVDINPSRVVDLNIRATPLETKTWSLTLSLMMDADLLGTIKRFRTIRVVDELDGESKTAFTGKIDEPEDTDGVDEWLMNITAKGVINAVKDSNISYVIRPDHMTSNYDGVLLTGSGSPGDFWRLTGIVNDVELEITRKPGDSLLEVSIDALPINNLFEVARYAKVGVPVSTLANRKIRYVRDSLRGNTSSWINAWNEIIVIDKDLNNRAYGLTPTTNGSLTNPSYCTDGDASDGNHTLADIATVGSAPDWTGSDWEYIQLDLGDAYDIDTIQVFHRDTNSRQYNHKLEVSLDGIDWFELFNSDTEGRQSIPYDLGALFGCYHNAGSIWANSASDPVNNPISGIFLGTEWTIPTAAATYVDPVQVEWIPPRRGPYLQNIHLIPIGTWNEWYIFIKYSDATFDMLTHSTYGSLTSYFIYQFACNGSKDVVSVEIFCGVSVADSGKTGITALAGDWGPEFDMALLGSWTYLIQPGSNHTPTPAFEGTPTIHWVHPVHRPADSSTYVFNGMQVKQFVVLHDVDIDGDVVLYSDNNHDNSVENFYYASDVELLDTDLNYFRLWDAHKSVRFFFETTLQALGSIRSTTITSEQLLAGGTPNALPFGVVDYAPEAGQAFFTRMGWQFRPWDQLFVEAKIIDPDSSSSRVDTVISDILEKAGCGAPTMEEVPITLARKTWYRVNGEKVLGEMRDAVMPPNYIVHDTKDGNIVGEYYGQDETPSYILKTLDTIVSKEPPEVFTSVRIVTEKSKFTSMSNYIVSPEGIFKDGIGNVLDYNDTTKASGGSWGNIVFKFNPRVDDPFPLIDSIKVKFKGILRVQCSTTWGNWDIHPNYNGIYNVREDSEVLDISDWSQVQPLDSDGNPTEFYVALVFYEASMGSTFDTPLEVYSVELQLAKQAIGLAKLTSGLEPLSTSYASEANFLAAMLSAGYTAEASGWVYHSPTKCYYKWADEDYLKRNALKYEAGAGGIIHREKIVELDELTSKHARTMSRDYLDTYHKEASKETATCIFEDVDIGQTIGYYDRDGELQTRLVVEYDRSGLGTDTQLNLGLANYS